MNSSFDPFLLPVSLANVTIRNPPDFRNSHAFYLYHVNNDLLAYGSITVTNWPLALPGPMGLVRAWVHPIDYLALGPSRYNGAFPVLGKSNRILGSWPF